MYNMRLCEGIHNCVHVHVHHSIQKQVMTCIALPLFMCHIHIQNNLSSRQSNRALTFLLLHTSQHTIHVHNSSSFFFFNLYNIIVVKAEVVDTSSVSDVVFPTSADELDNFTVVEMDDSAQITIPAGAITRLSAGNSGAS